MTRITRRRWEGVGGRMWMAISKMVMVGGTEGRPMEHSFIQNISGMAECNLITMNYWTVFMPFSLFIG